jgi:hypothetical protein
MENVPTTTKKPIPLLLLLSIKYFALDIRAVGKAIQDWGYFKATFVACIVFNSVTSSSIAYAMGTLAELSTVSAVFLGIVVFCVLWIADYSIAQIRWTMITGKINESAQFGSLLVKEKFGFLSILLIGTRIAIVLGFCCVTFPFWSTFGMPGQYKNFVNELNNKNREKADFNYNEKIQKLTSDVLSPYEKSLQEAYSERTSISSMLESHNKSYLEAKTLAANASAEMSRQLRGQTDSNRNGPGPLFHQAEAEATAASLKATAIESLITADNVALSVVVEQIKLLTESLAKAKVDFRERKDVLDANTERYIPIKYGDIMTKLAFMKHSYNENTFNIIIPFGIMLIVILIDLIAILTILCSRPKYYPIVLKAINTFELNNSLHDISLYNSAVRLGLAKRENDLELASTLETTRFDNELKAQNNSENNLNIVGNFTS